MHLEVMGEYWEGLVDEVIEHWDAAGIEKGVILATWMASRRSNDITLDAFTRYPDRFIPFGHVRPVDNWEEEIDRITQELGWTGLKLHQRELWYAGGNALRTVREIVGRAQKSGLRVVKIHLHEYETIETLSREFPDIAWILPHMGQYMVPNAPLRAYCDLARERDNVYLDTSVTDQYYDLDLAVRWAGPDKVTFASDGFMYSPLVERAKIDSLRLPTPHRAKPLSDEEYAMIMGGTMAKILGIDK
ncbi:hypothetical protein LLS1_38580 [Leifsonia sp. LS1]|nr:hypothetical protein LLS1_38580 [Leifsonia sp. LS1]